MDVVRQRDTLLRWADAKAEALPLYRQEKNARSIDGLPAPQATEGSLPRYLADA
jgi:hypothetical protein